MQIRFCLPFLAAFGIFILTVPALAWSPPTVGQACTGLRGPGPEVIRISGNYLGGRVQRDGVVDHRSFQSCFRDKASCERWIAGLAGRYPAQPGLSTCTSVRLR